MCEACHGIGEMLVDHEGRPVTRLRDAVTMVPCPDCGGSGIASCRDAAGAAQPEPSEPITRVTNGEGDDRA